MAALVFLAGGIMIGQHLPKKSQDQVTVATVSAKLKAIGELATEQYTYTGIYKLSSGQIPFITKKGFTMVYTAHFKAGVKVKQIKVQVSQSQVTVTLPKSQLLDKKIDPSSIKFYDQSYALFNWNQKEDITKAEQAALKKATAAAKKSGLLSRSQKNAKKLIRELLKGTLNGRKLVIKTAE
ncbi:DUF4230 domain-containing protein [Lactobacillus nasalidis]|uniref:DUF4230 domain-containing protein n=1 Tax=Lactobacillus nasalidis TaxID=2797258 RepID=UPI001FD36155|nr:DUF4230 domain-containing protein [Lactobacillus nasalidis]